MIWPNNDLVLTWLRLGMTSWWFNLTRLAYGLYWLHNSLVRDTTPLRDTQKALHQVSRHTCMRACIVHPWLSESAIHNTWHSHQIPMDCGSERPAYYQPTQQRSAEVSPLQAVHLSLISSLKLPLVRRIHCCRRRRLSGKTAAAAVGRLN